MKRLITTSLLALFVSQASALSLSDVKDALKTNKDAGATTSTSPSTTAAPASTAAAPAASTGAAVGSLSNAETSDGLKTALTQGVS